MSAEERPTAGGIAGPRPAGAAGALVGTVEWLAARWLGIVALALVAFLGLAFAAPLLDMAGLHRPSSAIYFLYGLSCHQLPQRSYFLGGTAHVHDWETVSAHYGLSGELFWTTFHRPIRDPYLGYQVALCQRDVAIFGALLLTVVGIAWLRRRRRIRPLPFRLYLLAGVPIAVDGISQLLGLRESTPLIRTLTGAIFGIATGLLVLPMVDEGLAESGPGRGVSPPREE